MTLSLSEVRNGTGFPKGVRFLQVPAPGDRGEVVYSLTRADLDAYAGRQLTEDEGDRFAEAIQWSSIPEALATIAEQFATPSPDTEGEAS